MDTTTLFPGMDLSEVDPAQNAVVRGLRRATCQVLWSALAYNVMHFAAELVT